MAVDAFSRFAVTVPIKGNINAVRAKEASLIIIKKMNRGFPNQKDKVRIVQTDKGSKFMGGFKTHLVRMNERAKGEHWKHILSFTGRSQSSSIVERVNGTLKRLVVKILGKGLDTDWRLALEAATEIYNSNYHSSIKTSPDSMSSMDAAGLKEVKERIYDRAAKRGTVVSLVHEPGDYVRLKIHKPKKLDPTFTFKNGLSKTLAKDLDDDTRAEFAGVFLVAGVKMGRSAVKEGPASDPDKPARPSIRSSIIGIMSRCRCPCRPGRKGPAIQPAASVSRTL